MDRAALNAKRRNNKCITPRIQAGSGPKTNGILREMAIRTLPGTPRGGGPRTKLKIVLSTAGMEVYTDMSKTNALSMTMCPGGLSENAAAV
jgi:hypothetical protein